MKASKEIAPAAIDRLYETLHREAEDGGYHLNPDSDFCKALIRGLLVNENRYGYRACPCRLASANKEKDLDIICPCDYRDADVAEFGACYCALYVSEDVKNGRRQAASIPERRPVRRVQENQQAAPGSPLAALPLPVWRCRVCGYLCARASPPESCPICKAKKERFARFL